MRWLLILLLLVFPAAAEDVGKTIYEKKCQMCHGDKGDGQKDKGIDFSDPAFWEKSYEEIYDAIKNGKGKMPAFPELSDEEIKSVVEYMRSFAPTPTQAEETKTPEKVVTEKKSPGFEALLLLLSGAYALRKIK